MAREIFNPNFSLFVQVPELGTTFQPNANSVVQNDEARGTNHLDFFKFVGRIIGKALYDGQLVDAFFTRSFYKHMLGDPLTYEVITLLLRFIYKLCVIGTRVYLWYLVDSSFERLCCVRVPRSALDFCVYLSC